MIYAMFVSGMDVYLSGTAYDSTGKVHAAYWKNGVLRILTEKYASSEARGIAVAGEDVYVVGTIVDNNRSYAVYWKNNVERRLAADADCNAIAVGP